MPVSERWAQVGWISRLPARAPERVRWGDIFDGDRDDADDSCYGAAADPVRVDRNCVGSLPGPMRR